VEWVGKWILFALVVDLPSANSALLDHFQGTLQKFRNTFAEKSLELLRGIDRQLHCVSENKPDSRNVRRRVLRRCRTEDVFQRKMQIISKVTARSEVRSETSDHDSSGTWKIRRRV
jgi:endo-beta-N-acetylglucosaminidase D